ncbi:MAG TPA: hypothetical protein VG734_02085 [Lacunisphaera sp.]|nr:hypothetical protein [Lacunisphaera sp.]
MAAPVYSVTLHHLAPGAAAAGLGYPDEQMPSVSATQLADLLHALAQVASRLTIYEPSTPEIRIKTDREVYVVRTRYRRLCFVGREAALRGEEHSVDYIMGTITGLAEPEVKTIAPRVFERPTASSPAMRVPVSAGFPEWAKIALLLVISAAAVGSGVWMLFRPARSLAPKYELMSASDSSSLLSRVAGEYQTGNQEGDRRLIVGPDGTLRIAKYGPAQAIAEEIIRTARGAQQNGQPALATSDPYLMIVKDADNVILYGQNYKRVVR